LRILIYGINYSPELTGVGKYTGEMSAWLAEHGHSVRVVTAPPYYPEWRVPEGYSSKKYSRCVEGAVEVIRCPLYVPAKVTTLSRLAHLVSFSASSAVPLFGSFRWRPEVIIQIAPTLFCSIQTLFLAWLVGSKTIVHIQDYEVDAMFGLSMARGGLKRIAHWAELKILNSFNNVSTISEGMMKRAIDKGVNPNKVIFLPNWSEVASFRNVHSNFQLLTQLGVDPSKKIVLYSGNMGEKQGLDNVIFAAKKMESNRDIHFLMVGDGVAKANLEHLALNLSLSNVTFLPLVPYDKLPELLAIADCHLVVQKSGVADSVMPSKLTNIFAVGGNAVITSTESTTLGRLCLKYPGIATLIAPDSVSALVDGIRLSVRMSKPNNIATHYAGVNLDKDLILNRFVTFLAKGSLDD
jgi:colanic acid biosynthesis glycosyl transferase WcaI